MKTKINIFSIAFFTIVLSSSLFTSCTEDGDTTKPVINLIAPAEEAILKIGADVHFDMELSDDVMLSSYKVEIHNNFNGHQHEASILKTASSTTPFFFQKSWDVSGKKNTKIHHHEIIIPEEATPGNYHLVVYCTDLAGNEAYVARNIILSHDGEEHEH